LVTETLIDSGEYDIIWQMPVILIPLVNHRYEQCVVLRPVKSQEAMMLFTSEWRKRKARYCQIVWTGVIRAAAIAR